MKPSILYDLAYSKDVFTIGFCESYLNDNVTDTEVLKEGWNVTKGDQVKRMCGGAVILTREEFLIADKLSYSNPV